jgi:esterase/lipase
MSMEKDIIIDSSDHKKIYGTLNQYNNKKDSIILFCHGLTTHKDNHLMISASRTFSKFYDCYRFDFYNSSQRARKLIESDVETHISDLNSVITHFSKKYENIYLIGHSFGGTAIYGCNMKKVKAIALWDCLLVEKASKLSEKYEWNKNLNCYILHQATDVLISKKLIEERQIQTPEILENITKPTIIICAGKFILNNIWKTNFNKINSKSKYLEIKTANHIFNKEKEENELFKETLEWFKFN